jgi:Cu2+-containing amine oxidase
MARVLGQGQGLPREQDHLSQRSVEGQDEQDDSFLSHSFESIIEEVDQSEDYMINLSSSPVSPLAKVSKF